MFESKRLKLSRWTQADIRLYMSWRNDPDIQDKDDPYTMTLLSEEYPSDDIMNLPSKPYSFAIINKESHHPIGSIGFRYPDFKNQNSEFFLLIGDKNQWNKGFATEAMKILLDYGFYELNFHKIWALVLAHNEVALSIYKKLGFKIEGTLRQATWRSGRWVDHIAVGLLDSEYLN